MKAIISTVGLIFIFSLASSAQTVARPLVKGERATGYTITLNNVLVSGYRARPKAISKHQSGNRLRNR